MIRVAVAGAAGRMGETVCAAVEGAEDMELTGRADPLLGIELDEVLDDAEVLVDFTRPDTALANALSCLRAGVHVGHRHDRLRPAPLLEARPRAGAGPRQRAVAPNFAIGAVLMMRFAAEAARHMQKAEIIELHHDAKLDAPSGTAALTAELMAEAERRRAAADPLRAPARPRRPPGGASSATSGRRSRSATTRSAASRSCRACCSRCGACGELPEQPLVVGLENAAAFPPAAARAREILQRDERPRHDPDGDRHARSTSELRVNEEAFVALMRHLAENGSDGFVVAGTTGEASTMTDEEQLRPDRAGRRRAPARARRSSPARAPTTRARPSHLTERATELGVDAMLSVTPYYNTPSRAGPAAPLRSRRAATDKPMLLYNIPGRTGTNMPPDLLAELAQIERIDGVKQANADELQPIDGLDAVRRRRRDVRAHARHGRRGRDLSSPATSSATRCGGWSTSPSSRAEIDASLRDVYATLFLTSSPTCTKAALNMLGLDAGGLRLPLVEATEEESRRCARCSSATACSPSDGSGASARASARPTARELRSRPAARRPRGDRQEHDRRRARRPDRRRRRRPALPHAGDGRHRPRAARLRLPARTRRDIEAIVITHGHEDHLGALPWVLRELGKRTLPPVYGGALTVAMARSKLDEHKLRDVELNEVEPGETIELGPFSLELVHMTHSIPDSSAVALGTELGTVLITGDYKFDQTPVDGPPADVSRLAELGREGVLLLCGDSTNVDRAGFSPSESVVGPHLEEVFARCEGRIVVTSFASNIHRVQQVVDAAARARPQGRAGRALDAQERRHRAQPRPHRGARGLLVGPREIGDFPDERVVIISTGSQGEPLSALRRMAYRDHPQVELREGDTVVFSATPIPGNERAVNETIDRLYHIGCDVITPRDAPVHASGHGYAEEVKLMLNLVKPRYVMPFHGDFKRLRLHAQLAEAVGIPPRGHLPGRQRAAARDQRARRALRRARAVWHDLRRRRRDRRAWPTSRCATGACSPRTASSSSSSRSPSRTAARSPTPR